MGSNCCNFSYGRKIYIYDQNGQQTEAINELWDVQINDWVSRSRTLFTYDEQGNNTEKISYGRDEEDSDWVKRRRYLYSYDEIRNRLEETLYEWNEQSSEWVLRRYESFDADGNQTEYLEFSWNSDTVDWIPYSHLIFTYDDNGNEVDYVWYLWEEQINNWLGIHRILRSYDANGNMIKEVEYHSRSETTTNWDRTDTRDYTYNDQGNVLEYVYEGYGSKYKSVSAWSYVLILPQTFSVQENCTDCGELGPMITGSYYSTENIFYSITGGNEDTSFSIDGEDGLISNVRALNYKEKSSYILMVEAKYMDSTRNISDEAQITIKVIDLNETSVA